MSGDVASETLLHIDEFGEDRPRSSSFVHAISVVNPPPSQIMVKWFRITHPIEASRIEREIEDGRPRSGIRGVSTASTVAARIAQSPCSGCGDGRRA